MRQFLSILPFLLIASCTFTAPEIREKVWVQSTKGNKSILVCSPEPQRDEDRVVVRLLCDGREILALDSHQIPYPDQDGANQSVRIHWRDDGKAVVVNLLMNGGSQETRPYYIVWDGCSAKSVPYEPLFPENHAGESNVYFEGWDHSGDPMLKVH